MKALFLNIGSELTIKKMLLLEEAIKHEKPDIFCIAEGYSCCLRVPGRLTCSAIEYLFSSKGYEPYYLPTYSYNAALGLGYRFNKFGLKVFVRNSYIPRATFTGAEQREEGRYIILRTEVNDKLTTFIFLHGKAKEGNANQGDDQYNHMVRLNDMINFGEVIDASERVIIMGDFNLEPWDSILSGKRIFNTTFFHNRNLVYHRRTGNDRIFYNPILEFVVKSTTTNLGGTFYNDRTGWALFDTILYDTSQGAVRFDVLTQLAKSHLLNTSPSIHQSFLNDNLDHLPILAEIK